MLESGERFPMLRQQSDWGDSRPNRSLADYVAPAGDHVGAFAVGIHGADELAAATRRSTTTTARSWSRRSPTGSPRRSPSGCTCRRGAPGTSRTRAPTSEELIAESYRGIRPAFGYPACPDHSEKRTPFDLLDAEAAGLALTESFAMMPAAAVSGLYFGHPEAKYFAVGRVGRDQVEDYAARKRIVLEEAERWLRPNLAYEPDA